MTFKPFSSNKTTTTTTTTQKSIKLNQTNSALSVTMKIKSMNSPVTRIKIQPVNSNGQNMGIEKYRRFCAVGFTRDKKGNCRQKKPTP